MPILIWQLKIGYINSEWYHIKNFNQNKNAFQNVVEAVNDENKESLDSLKEGLYESCRVDTVEKNVSDEDDVYIAFYLSDSTYYPSTESKYSMIIYQGNDKLPKEFESNINKKIHKNWFYVSNYKNYRYYICLLVSAIYVVFWILSVIALLKCKLTQKAVQKRSDFIDNI